MASGPTPLCALSVRGYVPPVPAAGVLRTPLEALNAKPVKQRPDFAQHRRRKTRSGDCERSGYAGRKDGAIGAGNHRRFIHKHCEDFAGTGGHTVLCDQGNVINSPRSGYRRSRKHICHGIERHSLLSQAPDPEIVGTGKPVVVSVNVLAVPTRKVAWWGLTKAGRSFTVSVKFCVAFGATPFCAVSVIG